MSQENYTPTLEDFDKVLRGPTTPDTNYGCTKRADQPCECPHNTSPELKEDVHKYCLTNKQGLCVHRTSPEKEETLRDAGKHLLETIDLALSHEKNPNIYKGPYHPPVVFGTQEPSYIDKTIEEFREKFGGGREKGVQWVAANIPWPYFEKIVREKLEEASKLSQVYQATEYTKGYEKGQTQRTQEIHTQIKTMTAPSHQSEDYKRGYYDAVNEFLSRLQEN